MEIKVTGGFIKRRQRRNELYARLDSGQVINLSEILKWFPERASEVENTFYRGDYRRLSKQLSEIFSELLPR